MPLIVVENKTVKQENMNKLSYWHKANVTTSVRENRLQWIASEGFFRTPHSYPLQKDWSDIVTHLPKAGMVTEGLLYPLQTSLNLNDTDEDEDGNYRWFTPCVSDEQAGSADAWEDYLMEGKTCNARLRNQVQYPTPTKEDYRKRGPNSRQQGLPEIIYEVEKEKILWPMPRVTGMMGGSAHRDIFRRMVEEGQISEEEDLRMAGLKNLSKVDVDADLWQKWPTPTRNDTAANRDIIQQSKRNSLGLAEVVRCYPEGDVGKWSPIAEEVAEKAIIGQLNPVWVEWLMGFPSHWSKADPAILELNKCR